MRDCGRTRHSDLKATFSANPTASKLPQVDATASTARRSVPLDRSPLPSQNPAVIDPPAEIPPFGRSVLALLSGDITRVAADAIVNAANSAFAHGGGVDGALRAAAGPELSGEMRRRYPSGTPTGSAVATGAYALPARWVIHAVGPVWGFGGRDKLDLLASAYRSVLQVADELGATTITTPAISAGTFGFPLETAADVALRTVRDYLLGETGIERVTFVLRPDAVEAFRRRLATI